jgi:hypothetical protein
MSSVTPLLATHRARNLSLACLCCGMGSAHATKAFEEEPIGKGIVTGGQCISPQAVSQAPMKLKFCVSSAVKRITDTIDVASERVIYRSRATMSQPKCTFTITDATDSVVAVGYGKDGHKTKVRCCPLSTFLVFVGCCRSLT